MMGAIVTEAGVTDEGSKLEEVEGRYSPDEPRPLGGYLRAMGTYAALAGGLAAAVKRRGGPPDVPTRDVVLGAVATFKAARLISEANVTSPLRAPLTRYEGPGAPGEVSEEVQEPTGEHRHAVAEFISCPYCLGTWFATAYGFGLALAPRWARFAASVLAANAGSDVLHKLYEDLQAR